jgi:hypothetical protein
MPALVWLAAFLFVPIYFRRQTFAMFFAAFFTLEIVADAYVSANAPLRVPAVVSWPHLQWVAIAFVILGDFRYFLAIERTIQGPETPVGVGGLRVWVTAVALAFIVPVLSVIPQKVWPDVFSNLRMTFLLYEVMFLILALVLRFIVLPRRLHDASAATKRYALRLTEFEIVQYALWASADVVITWIHEDAGFLLRWIPNLMYYVAFVPFATMTMPWPSNADRARG